MKRIFLIFLIWLAAYTAVAQKLAIPHFLTYGQSSISCIIPEGSFIWIGTEGSGIYYIDRAGTVLKHYTMAQGLPNDSVYCGTIDSQGRKWFGTGSGLALLQGSSWKACIPSAGISSCGVRSIAIDAQGIKWLGTECGLKRYDGKNWKNYSTQEGLPHDLVNTAAVDSKGTKWIGTFSGAAYFDGKKWISAGGPLEGADVISIWGDRGGRVWFGTRAGLYMKDRGSAVLEMPKDSAGNAHTVFCVLPDYNGYQLLGTGRGLVQMNHQGQIAKHDFTCPPFSRINTVAQDSYGWLWYGGHYGWLIWHDTNSKDK